MLEHLKELNIVGAVCGMWGGVQKGPGEPSWRSQRSFQGLYFVMSKKDFAFFSVDLSREVS